MNYKILIGSVVGASLLMAGTVFAKDGSSDEQKSDVVKVGLEGKVTLSGDAKVEDQADVEVKDEQSGDQQKEDEKSSWEGERGAATGTVRRGEEERGRDRKQGEEGRDRTASSSLREREQEDHVSASSSDDEQDNATSTEGERQREEHRSKVAEAVKELLNVADRDGGIGEEVRTIAEAQQQNHEKINEHLKKVEERNAFAKFFFGADQSAIDEAKKLVAENEAQIKQLAEVKARIATGTDQAVIDTQIKLLEKVNTEASATLADSEGGFSVFGWMFRLFGR